MDKKTQPNTAVTIFLKKKNKPIATLSLNGETEEQVKYILIMKGYGDEMPVEKDWDSMKQYILTDGQAKLTKKAKELGDAFDIKYRLLLIK